MGDVILLISVLLIFLFGFYIAKKIDRLLEEDYIDIQKENEAKEPSCVMLTDEVTEDEMIQEIRQFRAKHKDVKILVYSDTEEEKIESA